MSWMKLAQTERMPIFTLLLRMELSMKTSAEKSRSGKRNISIPPMPKMMKSIGPLAQPGLGILHIAIIPIKASSMKTKAKSRQANVPTVKSMGNRCTSFRLPGCRFIRLMRAIPLLCTCLKNFLKSVLRLCQTHASGKRRQLAPLS